MAEQCSPVAGTDERAIQSVQSFFLLFLYLRDVLFKNLHDATLSPLGSPHNMQIKAAITENLVFVSISVTYTWYQNNFGVYTHVFRGKKNQIKPFL